MKVAITVRFQNSYFSGGTPQVACALSRALAASGHDVALIHPAGEADWFIDVKEYATLVAPRRAWDNSQRYDAVIEVMWELSPEDRAACAKQAIRFVHKPPMFTDLESSVYTCNPEQRSYKNLTSIWTYDFYGKDDIRYLEFMSGVPVVKAPYLWDSEALDIFVCEESVPEWSESAAKIDAMIPAGVPSAVSWCARILESNFSNTSHCLIPLSIVSEIRKQNDPVRFHVHNGETVAKHPFFTSNVAANLALPDVSGNMTARVRTPDLRREKSVFLCHQRFRPLKSYMLDALYLGIPLIHNCEIVRTLGGAYFYELNNISDAVAAWKTMAADYAAKRGYFKPNVAKIRQAALRAKFGPAALAATYNTCLITPPAPLAAVVPRVAPKDGVLRVAFANMWGDFVPTHNFFLYLLAFVGEMNGLRVVNDQTNPNVVFFGPLSEGAEARYPGVPKVYYTGENAPPSKHPDVFLNLGFQYSVEPNYIRLPLWVLEINWWGANPDKLVNPRPVELKDAMRVDPAVLDAKSKFCAFVATNPTNTNRNIAFHVLNKWRGVDSAGRLFCNMPEGAIPANRGGRRWRRVGEGGVLQEI
jgi:hypothetical protein